MFSCCLVSMVSHTCVHVPDCPQVQCVEQYVAQQADELTLEPTEIINVIRKTNEGKNVERNQRIVYLFVRLSQAFLLLHKRTLQLKPKVISMCGIQTVF